MDHVRALGAIARKLENFVALQLRKLGEVGIELNNQSQEHQAVMRIIAEFESERSQWEEMKQLETQRLMEAGEKLARAWQQLEEQQRDSNLSNSNLSRHERPRRDVAPMPKAAVVQLATPVAGHIVEASLFEMRVLQKQVAEHSKRRLS